MKHHASHQIEHLHHRSGSGSDPITQNMLDAWSALAPFSIVSTLAEAVTSAYNSSDEGDVIILSPGCSSMDMFVNYKDRGDQFKKLVNAL